jgi:outer membrane protein assembly factor BamE (lipoprotein component of BamABCDE complex)
MKSKFMLMISLGIALVSLPACFSHSGSSAGPDANASNLTVGKVQGEIKEGMPASDVAAILGSPNIVTTDEKRREVWINSFGGGIIILGGSTRQAESTTTQKTLTIIIKFDEMKKVRDFAYNYTQF